MLKRIAITAGLIGLLGPAYWPGFDLVQLYISGTADRGDEFCGPAAAAHGMLVLPDFGAARDCFLSLPHAAAIALLSWTVVSILAAPAAFMATMLLQARRHAA